jgi:hypothetical protein
MNLQDVSVDDLMREVRRRLERPKYTGLLEIDDPELFSRIIRVVNNAADQTTSAIDLGYQHGYRLAKEHYSK